MKKEKYTLAVATSSNRKYLNKFLKQFSLEEFFSAQSTITDVRYGKPAPDIFLKAATRIRAKPEQCVVIEDSINGVIAAKRAGMKVIAVLSTTKKELFVGEAKPNAFIKHIGQVNSTIISKL
jgi:HAD superfamily hydrolase (TIGR01509 family)